MLLIAYLEYDKQLKTAHNIALKPAHASPAQLFWQVVENFI